jgi:hypothetical protein
LGIDSAAELLRQTEDEEEEADSRLTDVADAIYDASEELEDEAEDVEARSIQEEGETVSRTRTSRSSQG